MPKVPPANCKLRQKSLVIMASFDVFKKAGHRGGRALRRLADIMDTQPVNRFLQFSSPGHYYSPIPDSADIEANRATYFDSSRSEIPGVDLNLATQLATIARLAPFAADYTPALEVASAAAAGARYFLVNGFYESLDAFVLYGMLRMLSPQRMIEVGSGFSSALSLDVSARFLASPPKVTFVEPNPQRLLNLLRPEDNRIATVIAQPVQKLDPVVFQQLNGNDILFIDSSHVSKIGSDVNYLFFEVFPGLQSGVVIHIHDIFWPFEYPEDWFSKGRCWNELYLVRALLSASKRYEILHFNSYLFRQQRAALAVYPSWATSNDGGSIWLRVR